MSEYEQKVRETAAVHLVHCFNDDVGTKVKVDEEEHEPGRKAGTID